MRSRRAVEALVMAFERRRPDQRVIHHADRGGAYTSLAFGRQLEPTARAAARCHHDTTYCSRCDLLDGLGDLHVIGAEFDRDLGFLTVTVESPRALWAA